jgi:thiamine biosynthesis lipoprotein
VSALADISFRCMGSDVRIMIEGGPDPEAAAAGARTWLEEFSARLSRFEPDSELTALNADPRTSVPASPLLCSAVGAAVWAAERTDGLVDPTLVGAIERAGYASSRADATPAPLADALASAPERRPAQAAAGAAWREVSVDLPAGIVCRPAGVRIDTGGTGKGLAADALAHRLGERDRVAVDCGGDIRVAGTRVADEPFDLEIIHPLTRIVARSLRLAGGAAATSGIDVRVWQTEDGGFAHHLLDPATGAPAWTGLVGATALAPTALEAETLAKQALHSGPARAGEILGDHGGLAFCDDGSIEAFGILAA